MSLCLCLVGIRFCNKDIDINLNLLIRIRTFSLSYQNINIYIYIFLIIHKIYFIFTWIFPQNISCKLDFRSRLHDNSSFFCNQTIFLDFIPIHFQKQFVFRSGRNWIRRKIHIFINVITHNSLYLFVWFDNVFFIYIFSACFSHSHLPAIGWKDYDTIEMKI